MVKILIWGTGSGAEKFLEQIKGCDVEVKGFIESNSQKETWNNLPVFMPHSIKVEYDFIVVASMYVDEIRAACINNNINLEKVVFLALRIENNPIAVKAIEEKIPDFRKCYMAKKYLACSTFSEYTDLEEAYVHNYEMDYVRCKIFELCVENITPDMEGDVAELGVFRGKFAKFINRAFPDRTMYLFDTFEGFDDTETESEMNTNNCAHGQEWADKFKNTSEEIVLRKMYNRENCIIKKGFFPDSLDGLETKFVFVSIDVDFENSMYEGLKYFYPRVVDGGYLFIHDYNHGKLKGVKKAVQRFEAEYGRLKKVPIADRSGSLVICK